MMLEDRREIGMTRRGGGGRNHREVIGDDPTDNHRDGLRSQTIEFTIEMLGGP